MKIRDLDNNIRNWKIGGEVIVATDNRHRSNLHIKARQLLKDCFPVSQVKEEVPIPIRLQQTLNLDFYIPVFKIAVEVHGIQHYNFSAFFHYTHLNFRLQQIRDEDKIKWCKLNNIKLIVLPYNEDIDEWRQRITRARTGQDE